MKEKEKIQNQSSDLPDSTDLNSKDLKGKLCQILETIPKEVYTNKKIEQKLSIFSFCKLDETEFDKNFIYKCLLNFNEKDFKYNKNTFNASKENIETIEWFILNLKKIETKRDILLNIIIKNEKKSLIIYVGVNDELNKITFKKDNSDDFLNGIIKYCENKKIKFYKKNKKEISSISNQLEEKFCQMFKSHNKEQSYRCITDRNQQKYITPNKNDSTDSKDSSDLFDNYIKPDFDDIESYINDEDIIILDHHSNKKELKIFILNIKFFQEHNRKSVSYLLNLNVEKNSLDIFFEINYRIFKIIFNNPGLSRDEYNKL